MKETMTDARALDLMRVTMSDPALVYGEELEEIHAARDYIAARLRGEAAPEGQAVRELRAGLIRNACYAGEQIGDERVVLLSVALAKVAALSSPTAPAPVAGDAVAVGLQAAAKKLRDAARRMDDGSRWVPGVVFKQFTKALTAALAQDRASQAGADRE